MKSSVDWHIEADGAQDAVFFFFSVAIEQLFPLFGVQEIPLLQNCGELFKKMQIYPTGSPLANQCFELLSEVPSRYDVNQRCQLLRIAVLVIHAEFNNVDRHQAGCAGGEEHMTQVLETLPTDALLSMSVGDLAGAFGCSRRHLNRLFHQHFGMSVAALRMEMRLLKAASLMRDPHAKIINVAEQCGFNHLGLFNTCFKRRFGTSPGQWRKDLVLSNEPPAKGPSASFACPVQTNGLCPLSGAPFNGHATALSLHAAASQERPVPPPPKASL